MRRVALLTALALAAVSPAQAYCVKNSATDTITCSGKPKNTLVPLPIALLPQDKNGQPSLNGLAPSAGTSLRCNKAIGNLLTVCQDTRPPKTPRG